MHLLDGDHPIDIPGGLFSVDAPTDWGRYSPGLLGSYALSLRKKYIGRTLNRRLMRWSLAPSTYDIVWQGAKLRCYPINNFTEYGIVFREATHEGLDRLVGELGVGDTFLDLGANCGAFTVLAAKTVGVSGRVLAVEPNPEMADRVRFNVAANSLGNVDVAQCAIGPSNGSATLHICRKELGQSSIAVSKDLTQLPVEVKTLEHLCAVHGIAKIDALKIDIEGYEDQALIPFFLSAPQPLWPRTLLMETGGASLWKQDCITFLLQKGYAFKWQDGEDALLTFSGS